MTTNDRPLPETAAVNCQADSASVEPQPDKTEGQTATCGPGTGRVELCSGTLAVALELAAEGFHVFPLDHPSWPKCQGAHGQTSACDGKRGKHPLGPWKEQATTDLVKVRQMFAGGPFNIGIACGPSKLLVVDEDGPRDLRAFAATAGLVVPDTRAVRTGRGTHLFFRHDHALRALGNGEGLLREYDINIRGAGGYVVAPGSTHETGSFYDFVEPSTPVLPPPEWLLDAVTTRPRRQSPPSSADVGRTTHSGLIPLGKRHSELVSYAGRLANSSLHPDELKPVFLERYYDCVQPPGAVVGARYEDPTCGEPFTREEALALLADVLSRYQDQAGDGLSGWTASTPAALSRTRARSPFPVDALPDPLGPMVAAVAEFTQTDAAMAGTTCLAMLGAAAGGRVLLEVRPGWREPLNLFTATVAGPGERKSAVQQVMSSPLQDAEVELAERVSGKRLEATMTKEVAAKAADIARQKASKADDPDERKELLRDALNAVQAAESIEVPILPRLLADDVTPERCAGLLAEQDGRLAVVSAEGGIFDVLGGRYSGGIPSLDVFLKGHSGDQLRIDRQSREPQIIRRPALTLSLMLQPSVLNSIARNKDFRGRGLLARFLYSVPESKVGHRVIGANVVPEEVERAYGRLIKGLAVELADWLDPAVLQLSPQALSALDEVARELEPQLGPGGELQHIADWGSKFVGAVARIAGLVHLAAHPENGWRMPVEAESMERAVRLGMYYKEQALYAFDQMQADPGLADADYLLEAIRRLGNPVVSRRDLHVNANRSRFPMAKDLDAPLKLLEDSGHLLRQPEPPRTGPGRPPSPTWRVHPSLIEGAD